MSNDELVRVERKPDDPRYRPVYVALLTRNGLARDVRVEALATLAKMDKASATAVLLDALAKVAPDATQSGDQLLTLLCTQPADALKAERDRLKSAVEGTPPALVLRGAYGAMLAADGDPGPAWELAASHEGHLVELLRSLSALGPAEALRARLFAPVSALVEKPGADAAVRAEAIAALGWTRRDAVTFQMLAQVIVSGASAQDRGAAVQAIRRIPEAAWPKSDLEPLGRALVAMVKETETSRRTEPPSIDAVQFGERVAAVLPAESGRALRRDLRALGVQVVRIETLIEQVQFDLNWFAVEAGKAVQIVFTNPDAMPHNIIVGKPGSLQELGVAGGNVPVSSDPNVKPFVPDSPNVLYATRLVQQGETEQLAFTAPKDPGEYVFLCSFPGHWVRMYGVMLVVPSMDAWEAKPTTPTDPVTKQPFGSKQNVAAK